MRRSSLIYLLLFAIAVVIYIVLNNRAKTAADSEALSTPEPTEEISFLFDATDGVPTRIRIKSKAGEIVEMALDANNVWAVVLPTEAAADQGYAEAVASQVTVMFVRERIQNIDLEVVGLNDPEYVLTAAFSSGVERKVEVGVMTPSESGYYTRNEAGEILIVSRDAVDALLGLLINPPYAPTATPLPSALETGSVESATPQP